ncbi:MAG: F-type H+-transporting ATPase subunit gamma [Eubacteriales bacterium]|nr:F-type H+-transporting ATPase subunit gamma [Eubacteriales bacterium]
MASMRDIRRRIKSIKNTQQITKAMKLVAAAKLRRAQERVIAARPYARLTREVLSRVAAARAEYTHPLLEVREPRRVAYVIITADRGLCGGFNANLIRKTLHEIRAYDNVSLITVGRKGRDFFRRLGYDIKAQFVGLGEDIQFGKAREIAHTLIEAYTQQEFDEIYMVYSEFRSAISQRPVTVKLLPVEPPAEERKQQWSTEYIFEPDPGQVLDILLPRYVETMVYSALLESKASEHGARMTAMGSATDNAAELINKLTISLNRARQAAITKEISEIVGGAAALDK